MCQKPKTKPKENNPSQLRCQLKLSIPERERMKPHHKCLQFCQSKSYTPAPAVSTEISESIAPGQAQSSALGTSASTVPDTPKAGLPFRAGCRVCHTHHGTPLPRVEPSFPTGLLPLGNGNDSLRLLSHAAVKNQSTMGWTAHVTTPSA